MECFTVLMECVKKQKKHCFESNGVKNIVIFCSFQNWRRKWASWKGNVVCEWFVLFFSFLFTTLLMLTTSCVIVDHMTSCNHGAVIGMTDLTSDLSGCYRDAQRLEEFHSRNQQLKEEQRSLRDTVSSLEERWGDDPQPPAWSWLFLCFLHVSPGLHPSHSIQL